MLMTSPAKPTKSQRRKPDTQQVAEETVIRQRLKQ